MGIAAYPALARATFGTAAAVEQLGMHDSMHMLGNAMHRPTVGAILATVLASVKLV
jgi:hypothetical protein